MAGLLAKFSDPVTLMLMGGAVLLFVGPWLWSAVKTGLAWLANRRAAPDTTEVLKSMVALFGTTSPGNARKKLADAYDLLFDALPDCQPVLIATVWPAIGAFGRQKQQEAKP